jgi:phosphoribosylglycinamide formyltransferase-1
MRPALVVFASGTKDGGGSGFENLVNHSHDGDLDADIVAVVSNHENGGVRARAERLGIPFVYFNPRLEHPHILTYVSMSYRKIVEQSGAEWVALSGWLKRVEGLDPARTFNIHPALLSFGNGRFGGPGLYGHHVHEAVKVALDAGEITESGFTMHFTTEEYDRGPIFFECRIPLASTMSADDIASAVNVQEHLWQSRITNMVVHGDIRWDGKRPETLQVPQGYVHLPKS